MKYDILEVKKCDEKIDKHLYTIVNDIKLIPLCGVIIFACERGLFNRETIDTLLIGGISVGTLSTISLVKSICNIYLINQKKKELESENKRK